MQGIQGNFNPFMTMNLGNGFNNMNNMNNMNGMNNMNNMNSMNNMYNMNNMINTCFFPNQNQMMPQQVMAGNWTEMYTMNQQNMGFNNYNPMNKKLSVIFKTGKGLITIVFIDYGKTVNYLIQVYFKRMGKPGLINRPKEIGLIYNARLINFNESRLVEDFFGGATNVTITVNDIGDLIGA